MIRHFSLKLSVVLVTSYLAGMHTQAIAATDPFVEQTGRLIIETESVPSEGDWSVQSDIAGHTGTAYLVWQGSNNYAESQAERGDPIRYSFRITTPGNYQLNWRSRNTVGLDATEHNDSWVRFPTGTNIDGEQFLGDWTKAYMGQVAQWTWDTYTVDGNNQFIRQYFEAGEHYLEIAGRSNGHSVDRLALFQYENEAFSATAFDVAPASPKASELELAGHNYTGNSCVAGVLGLSAENAARYNGETLEFLDGDILVDGSPQYSLLQFNVPDSQSDTATLTLGSLQQALSLSVYLGSHSATEDSLDNDLPYPSTLLGQFQSADATNQLLSIDIDRSMLSTGENTLILVSEPGNQQAVYGIGTLLEPRLDFDVSAQYCQNYHLEKTGLESAGTEESGQEESGTQESVSQESGSGTVEESSQTDTNTENTSEASIDVDTGITGTSTPVTDPTIVTTTNTGTDTTAQTGNIDTPVDTRDADSETTSTSTSGSGRSGGSLSIYSLLWLSLAGFLYLRARSAQFDTINNKQ